MSQPIVAHTLLTDQQLGELLRAARKSKGLRQKEVAGRVGLSQNRISYLEAHPGEISVAQLLQWCAALGLDLQLVARVTSTPTTDW